MEKYLLTKDPIKLGIDLDGVMLAFDKKSFDEFAKRSVIFKDEHDMHMKIKQDESLQKMHKEIFHETGFYANLPLIEGAIDAFKELDKQLDCNGNKMFEIFIVTTPSYNNPTCASDKIADVIKHFGMEVAKNTIICGDKTLINYLDILIDDRLNISGKNGSSEFTKLNNSEGNINHLPFEHIRFRSPMYTYPENYPFLMINNWTDGKYKDIIEIACIKKNLLKKYNNIKMQLDENSKYHDQRIKELSILTNLYPHKFDMTKSLKEYKLKYEHLKNNEILSDTIENLTGRIQLIRSSGSKLYFAIIESDEITLQVLGNFKYNDNSESFNLEKKLLKRGDIIGVIGYPTRSNKGELSILVKNITILAPCLRILPKVNDFEKGLSDINLRFSQRYLDFILHPENRKIFKIRAQAIKYIRQYLDDRDFIEIETPIISVKIGGANARPFETHYHDLNKDMYLRIAPELYLKQLIIGGFNKIYELGKQFRNENLDSIHNPEFQTVEIYQAFADYTDMMVMTENIFSELIYKIFGTHKIIYNHVDYEKQTNQLRELDFSLPFQKLDLIEDLQKYGKFEFPDEILSDFNSEKSKQFLQQICVDRNINCSEPQTIPRLLDKLVGTYLEPLCINPTFIINHPQIMSPLSKYHRSNNNLTERFELFICGREFANAYTELNDPFIQKSCFENQEKNKQNGDLESQSIDNDYVLALQYGLPPTGGLGIGIDRLVMLLTNQSSIKEVITFTPD